MCSCYASLAKKLTDKTPAGPETYVPLSSVQSLYEFIELKLSLHTRLARQTHARRMHNRREVYCQSILRLCCRCSWSNLS
jgi:hypothetical protein